MKRCFFKFFFNLNYICFNEFKLLVFKLLSKRYMFFRNLLNFNAQYRNFCYMTGTKRSILNTFLLSRWNIKSSFLLCNGLRKLSW